MSGSVLDASALLAYLRKESGGERVLEGIVKNRRMGWGWFDEVTAGLPLPLPRITHPWTPRRA